MNGTRYAVLSMGVLATLAAAPLGAQAQQSRPAASLWQEAPAARAAVESSAWAGRLLAYRTVAPNQAALQATLAAAPLEGTPAYAPILTLPTPDGGTARFRIVEAPVMEPGLAAQFPDIKTYAGIGLDDPTATLRADVTMEGFHAQVLSRQPGQTFYIDPVVNASPAQGLVAYWRRDLNPASAAHRGACQTVAPATATPALNRAAGSGAPTTGTPQQRVQTSLGSTLRTYRVAVAATGEYTAYHGGTVAQGQAAIVTTVNRVTGVYEKELAVRLVLVANNSSLVYTNAATDPYANTSNDLAANQTNITAVIGSANYDIGHLVGTGGGGVAGLGVVCNSTQKARGLTGSPAPINDAFDIDYVAHEMGHQFSGNHTFNGSVGSCTGANRNASTAYEPGSGSTIQAYAGICDGSADGGVGTSQDLQAHSDAYFHAANISEMTTFINATTCPTSAASGNTAPTVTTPVNKSIPANTPFKLTGSATDAEGDALTYCWEEMDLGAQGAPIKPTTTQTVNLTPPLFRSWSPTASPTRYFPRLDSLRHNTVPYGEALPTVARALKFICTVRDQHFSASLSRIVGGVNQSSTVTLTVVNTGAAFAVTAPNAAGTLSGTTTVTWNVAGTTANGINCATVNVLLSTDGGLTFPTTLATGVANSGSANVTLPNTPTSTARIMVAAADNYFFDISNANFTIISATSPTITSFTPTSGAAGTVVTITGTNFTGATSVTFNGTNASSFTVNSATSITATVAAGTSSGPITIVSPNGTGISGTSYTVPAPPTVTSFTPTTGAAGTAVTITGTNFTGATAVAFNGTAATFSVTNATTISTTVPVGATTGTISVTNSLGTGTSAASFTVIAAPLNDLCTAPNLPVLTCGNAQTGTTVNATATGDPTGTCTETIDNGGVFYRFVGTGGPVTISTCGATTTYDSKLFVFTGTCGSYTCVIGDDDLTCGTQTRTSTVTFNSTAGTNYFVFVSGFQLNTGPFTIKATCGTAPPTITSFSPASGLVGTSVTITGTAFTGTSSVQFNGTAATSFTVNSATSVTATVPVGATTGPITVVTATGQVQSATNFTVLRPPVIASQSFNLAENSANGTVVGTVAASDPDAGQTLTYAITAGNGSGAFAINATTGQLTVANAAPLNFETTPSFALTVQVTDNGSPTTSSSATVTVNLTNVNETPAFGAQNFSVAENTANGTIVGIVVGTDPDAGTTLTYTILSGNTSGAFTFVGNQLRVANSAALDFEATPSFSLSVQVSDGALTATNNVTVTVTNVVEPPTVLSFTPAQGPVGTSVTVTGTRFTGATQVAFNGNNAAFSVTNDNSLTATVPAGSTTGRIRVTNAEGVDSSAASFCGTTIATTTGATRCGPGSVTLLASGTPMGGSYRWYSVPTGGTAIAGVTGSSYTVTLSGTTTFYVATFGDCESTTRTAVTGTVNPMPTTPAASATPSSITLGQSTTLAVSNVEAGATYSWSGSGLSSSTGSSVSATPAVVGTNTYTVISTLNGCTSVAGTVNVTVTPASTSVPVITAVSPARNAKAAARASNVTVTFDQPMSAASASALRVFSPLTGKPVGTASVSGATVTFNPTTDLKPGEAVDATITTAAQNGSGQALVKGQVWQFMAAATGGTGAFSGTGSVAVGTTPRGVALADVDGDGDLDILSANAASGQNTVSVRLNSGTGTYSGATNVAAGTSPYAVATGDVDGDGDVDLLACNYLAAGMVSIRLNNGAGTFSGSGSVAVGTNPANLTLGDIDADGDLDLLTANYGSGANSVSVRFNNGAGAFSGTGSVTVGTGPFQVVLADVDNDGDLDLLTANLGTGANSVSVRTNDGTGTFSGTQNVPVGAICSSVAVGDVDGDGDADLVATNYLATASAALQVRLNTGSGTFATTGTSIAVAANPYAVVLADVDADGDLDALTSNYGNASASIRFNNGAGVFSGTTNAAVAASPIGLATGDVDGDGDLDFVTSASTTAAVSIRFNQNAGGPAVPTITSFTPASGPVGTSVTITGTNLTGATAVAFNGTAATFTVNSATSITTTVPAGATTGTLAVTTTGGTATSATAFTVTAGGPTITSFSPATGPVGTSVALTGTGFTGVTVVAFNGTAATFTVNSATSITTTVPAGATTGTISVTTTGGLATSATAFTVTVAGGSAPVLVSVSPTRNAKAAARTSNASATFDQAMSAASASALRVFGSMTGKPAGVASGSGATLSFNPTADFKAGELVSTTLTTGAQSSGGMPLAAGQVWQFTAAATGGTGTLTGTTNAAIGTNPRAVALADVDGDGDLDLLSALGASTGATAQIRLNNGAGTFSGTGSVAVGGGPRGIAVGDVDGDGDVDLATANAYSGQNSVSVRLNNGTGTFSGTTTVAVGSQPYGVALADVDADGDLDMLTANYAVGTASVRFNDGTGVFSGATNLAVGGSPFAVTMGDVDNDGDLDLLVANYLAAGTVTIRLNNGAGTFSGTGSVAVGTSPTSVTLSDVDGDGDLDLLAANYGGTTVSVRLNNGTGTFSGSQEVAVGAAPYDVKTGDLDGDGDLDLLVPNYSAATVSVRLNDGAGTFSGTGSVAVATNPINLAIGDVDGDGDLDVAAANYSSASVSIRFNQNAVGPRPQGVTTGSALLTPRMSVLPNPAHGRLRISEASVAAAEATLQDATGRIVSRTPLAEGQGTLELTGLPAGVYVLRAGAQTCRVVVE